MDRNSQAPTEAWGSQKWGLKKTQKHRSRWLSDTLVRSKIWSKEACSLFTSELLTGTTGTDRVQPRRAVDRAGMSTTDRRVGRTRVDEFFFQNRTLSVSYPCPSRVHGYHGHGYGYGYVPYLFLFVVSIFFYYFYFINIFLFYNVVKYE
jgi:hypothetical protein